MTPPPALIQALADRYTIERELGQGGMATVYLAEDVKHQRKVAVKVLRPELAATLGPDRFAREIAVAARLQHPHILGLLDSGDTDGFFYYVMPYVEGETLRDRLTRAGELPVPDASGSSPRSPRRWRWRTRRGGSTETSSRRTSSSPAATLWSWTSGSPRRCPRRPAASSSPPPASR